MTRAEAARPRALAGACLALAAVLALVFARKTFVGCCDDDADYVIGALSILQGRLVALNSPGAHAFAYHWPGLSLLLAPFAALAAPRWQALKLVPFALVAGSAALALRRFERRLGAPWAVLALAAFALNPATLRLASIVMAEPLLLFLALLSFERLDAPATDGLGGSAALAFLLGLAALARPEGVVLAAAAAAALLRARRPRAAAAAALGPALAVAAWTWAKSLSPGGPSYWADWLRNLDALRPATLLLHGLSVLATLFAGVVFASPAPRTLFDLAAGAVLTAAALGVCAYGAVDPARRGAAAPASDAAAALFAAGVLLLHLLWPVIDARFFWPLLPFALEALCAGARRLAARSPARRRVALALAAALGLWCAGRATVDAAAPTPVPDRLPAGTFEWVRANVPADANVYTDIAPAFYLYTSRRAALTGAADADGADEFHGRLLAQGFSYVCYRVWTAHAGANLPRTEQAVRAFAASLRWASSRPDLFARVYFNPEEGAAIYAVLRGPDGGAERAP